MIEATREQTNQLPTTQTAKYDLSSGQCSTEQNRAMTFEGAFRSYMIVSGTERSDAYQDRLKFGFFASQFGTNKSVSEISPRDISHALGALRDKRIKRKGQMVPLTPAAINRHTQFLRRVL